MAEILPEVYKHFHPFKSLEKTHRSSNKFIIQMHTFGEVPKVLSYWTFSYFSHIINRYIDLRIIYILSWRISQDL